MELAASKRSESRLNKIQVQHVVYSMPCSSCSRVPSHQKKSACIAQKQCQTTMLQSALCAFGSVSENYVRQQDNQCECYQISGVRGTLVYMWKSSKGLLTLKGSACTGWTVHSIKACLFQLCLTVIRFGGVWEVGRGQNQADDPS